jgi:fluoroquinolone transport system ATP-binding protein
MIEVAKLTFTYPKASTPTLFGLDFHIDKQEIFGFLGPSGAGKSTTQKILIGLLRGYGGAAKVMDREVRDWGHAYYESVGVSFELPNHHKRLTARENLEHFGSLYAGPIREPLEVLRWVGLEDAADQRVDAFSKGMKIRLNVARSLLHRPKLLFLDEPTSGLDPVNARNVRELILRLREEGTTVFLTTHDMHVADQLCDRVAFITNGTIATIGAPEALKREHGRRVLRVDCAAEGEGAPTSAEFPLDGLGENQAFIELLRTRPIAAIHSQETTLDNVFIEVTGEALVQ